MEAPPSSVAESGAAVNGDEASKGGVSGSVSKAASWMDEASISLSTRTALEGWSSRLLEFPPPDRIHEFVQLRATDELGMHMLAAPSRGYEAGDLLLRERAVLRIPGLPPHVEETLERQFRSRAVFLGPALSVNWATVSPEVRDAVLKLFWAHPVLETAQSALVKDTRQACAMLLDMHPGLREAGWETESLLRYLHIVDLNIHRDGEVRENERHAGLFVLGSKFSNSCEPNCRWSFGKTGCLEYHAIRRIEPGELFTFSYIGNGLSLLEGTVARRRRLASLWFVCQCSRCLRPDLSRQMQCPRCGSPHCMPLVAKGASDRKDIDWTGEVPLKEVIREAVSWHCSACGAELAAKEMPLALEDKLAQSLPDIMDRGARTAKEDQATVERLMRQAEETLGPEHWTRILSTFAWLQKCLLLLRTESIIDFHEQTLQRRCRELAKWFKENFPLGIEQRLSVLCLAVRLARNFEECDFQLWGYDPADPLGDGSRVAKDMVQASDL